MELDKSPVSKETSDNGRRVPLSLWRSVAKVQMEVQTFVYGKEKQTTEELIVSSHDDAKAVLQLVSSINRVLDAYDVLYDDSLCTGYEPEVEDTSHNVSEQAALSYIKKTHSSDFYDIVRHIAKKGYVNVDANYIAENKNLSDEEKLRLMFIYMVADKSEKEVVKFMGKEKTPEQKRDEALSSCRDALIYKLVLSCFASPDVRRTAIQMAFKDYSDCCEKAYKEYEKNRKKS